MIDLAMKYQSKSSSDSIFEKLNQNQVLTVYLKSSESSNTRQHEMIDLTMKSSSDSIFEKQRIHSVTLENTISLIY